MWLVRTIASGEYDNLGMRCLESSDFWILPIFLDFTMQVSLY
jgi:hypothetical protein